MELFQPSRPLSLLLVDDTPLIRQEVRHLLEPLTTVRLAGEAADGESGVKMALALRPDIVIMDVQMPGLNSIDALINRRITSNLPRTPVNEPFQHDRAPLRNLLFKPAPCQPSLGSR